MATIIVTKKVEDIDKKLDKVKFLLDDLDNVCSSKDKYEDLWVYRDVVLKRYCRAYYALSNLLYDIFKNDNTPFTAVVLTKTVKSRVPLLMEQAKIISLIPPYIADKDLELMALIWLKSDNLNGTPLLVAVDMISSKYTKVLRNINTQIKMYYDYSGKCNDIIHYLT